MSELTPATVAALSDEELDTLCAERVMGWWEVRVPTYKDPAWGNIDGFVKWPHNWSPATSLADAAMCTEAMRRKGWVFSILIGDDFVRVAAHKFRDAEIVSEIDPEVTHPTEPRARAEAALRAAIKDSPPKP